jgi:nitrate reductase beta subunit
VALPLFPQLGLEPNVYYVPPVHAPLPYLRQMFGPGVDQAIETYKNGPNDPDLQAILALFGSTEKIVPRWKRKGDMVFGYEEDGSEILRVPTREPVLVRPAFDPRLKVLRVNTP